MSKFARRVALFVGFLVLLRLSRSWLLSPVSSIWSKAAIEGTMWGAFFVVFAMIESKERVLRAGSLSWLFLLIKFVLVFSLGLTISFLFSSNWSWWSIVDVAVIVFIVYIGRKVAVFKQAFFVHKVSDRG